RVEPPRGSGSLSAAVGGRVGARDPRVALATVAGERLGLVRKEAAELREVSQEPGRDRMWAPRGAAQRELAYPGLARLKPQNLRAERGPQAQPALEIDRSQRLERGGRIRRRRVHEGPPPQDG